MPDLSLPKLEGGFWGCWEGGGLAFGRMGGLGRRAGGRSVTPMRGEAMGLKVATGSLERRDEGPGSGGREGRGLMGLRGLGESDGLDKLEGVEPDGHDGLLFTCSRVSSTRSGAAVFPFCLSSSRSSFKARLMVSSRSWRERKYVTCLSVTNRVN